jgi:AcrR family transcriptional regulator
MAEETRRRIVNATFDLHAEQGIAATTMKEIAARAGVSVGSVYHHFPTYDDAINACGAHAFELAPFPTETIFDGADSRRERVRRLARAMFRMFAGVRAFGSVIADQGKLPMLRPFVAQEQAVRRTLAAVALGAAGPAAETLAVLLDHGTYNAFTRLGFGADEAADRIAEVANAWLDRPAAAGPRNDAMENR